MNRRRLVAFGTAIAIILPSAGCGNASNIEIGVPSQTAPPKDFDPGGDVAPDMKGGAKKAPGKGAKP